MSKLTYLNKIALTWLMSFNIFIQMKIQLICKKIIYKKPIHIFSITRSAQKHIAQSLIK
jgi:hypothetical protein